MPKIVFWNVARSGALKGSLPTDMLCEDLAGLGETYSPDAIVLCECLNGFIGHKEILPGGYQFVMASNRKLYTGDNMLRYALLEKVGMGCRARLLSSAGKESMKLRPAMGVSLPGGASFVALHAASISNSQTVQVKQLIKARDSFSQAEGRSPNVLIGDFNIDAQASGTRAKVKGMLDGSSLTAYQMRWTRTATHKKGATLDWALTECGVSRWALRAIKPSVKTQEEKRKDKYLKIYFENQKRSDHLPIMASW
jgi:hypothetical protein